MIHYILVFLATGVSMLLMDAIWLGLIVPRFYRPRLERISQSNAGQPFSPQWSVTFFIYFIVTGLIVMIVLPRVWGYSAFSAFSSGALLGLVVYGIYDLSTFSLLKDVSINLVLSDIVWGVVLCGLTAISGQYFDRIFF